MPGSLYWEEGDIPGRRPRRHDAREVREHSNHPVSTEERQATLAIMITRKHPDLLDAEAIANGVLGTITGFVPASDTEPFDVSLVENVEVRKFKQQPKLLLVKILSSTKSFVLDFPPGVIGLPPLKAALKLNNIPNLSHTPVTVEQFPVVPAFTTEKLQGQTCHDGIIVTKLERQKGVPRQTLYVALSRSTSLSKVTLTEPITREYLGKFVPARPTIQKGTKRSLMLPTTSTTTSTTSSNSVVVLLRCVPGAVTAQSAAATALSRRRRPNRTTTTATAATTTTTRTPTRDAASAIDEHTATTASTCRPRRRLYPPSVFIDSPLTKLVHTQRPHPTTQCSD